VFLKRTGSPTLIEEQIKNNMADEVGKVGKATSTIPPCFDCHAHIYADDFSEVSIFQDNIFI
jgi:hypothetical protein